MSHTFRDTQNRTWDLTVTVDTVRRVRHFLDIDLMEVATGKSDLIERLISDPMTLADVIFAVVKPQADEQGVTDEDFGRALGGDAIDDATQALLEGLVGFFPRRKREMLQRAVAKLDDAQNRMLDLAIQRIDSPEMDQMIESELRKVGDSPISSPASVESTQVH